MCGRFINLTKTNSIKKKFDIDSQLIADLISYNISPSQTSNIIFRNKIMNLDQADRGYSFFDKESDQERSIINSRLETISSKVLFKESYHKRKCVIPINGYYEWCIRDNKKIPFFIHIPPFESMYLAGIWKYINFQVSEKKVFTIITKNSNNSISQIHHRMPVILSVNEAEEYLNDVDSSFLNIKFTSMLESDLDFYSVSTFVNNPLNNSKECIKYIP